MLIFNYKNSILHLYMLEFLYRSFYILLSFIFCVIVILHNIPLMLLIEAYPFIKLVNKKFIAINITDLIEILWLLSISTSFLFIFPLFFYHLIVFFKGSWYLYQHYFINKIIKYIVLLYYSSIYISYLYFLPLILQFLSQWEIKAFKNILNIKFELHILTYIIWILQLKYYITFFFCIVFLVIINIYIFLDCIKIYKFIRYYKKQIIFINMFFLFLISPVDITLQFIIMLINILIIEFIYIFLCYKMVNSSKCKKFKNAYNTTIIK